MNVPRTGFDYSRPEIRWSCSVFCAQTGPLGTAWSCEARNQVHLAILTSDIQMFPSWVHLSPPYLSGTQGRLSKFYCPPPVHHLFLLPLLCSPVTVVPTRRWVAVIDGLVPTYLRSTSTAGRFWALRTRAYARIKSTAIAMRSSTRQGRTLLESVHGYRSFCSVKGGEHCPRGCRVCPWGLTTVFFTLLFLSLGSGGDLTVWGVERIISRIRYLN